MSGLHILAAAAGTLATTAAFQTLTGTIPFCSVLTDLCCGKRTHCFATARRDRSRILTQASLRPFAGPLTSLILQWTGMSLIQVAATAAAVAVASAMLAASTAGARKNGHKHLNRADHAARVLNVLPTSSITCPTVRRSCEAGTRCDPHEVCFPCR